MASISGLSTAGTPGVRNPYTLTLPIVLANTEQSHTFVSLTKRFRIYNDGMYVAKLSYQLGESGTNYVPIYPGDEIENDDIVATSVTIYVQSPGLINLHLEYWT